MEDNIKDILDYSTLDVAYLQSQGGTFDASTNTVRFANQTIPAKGKLTKNFRVTMKSPIPATNTPNPTAPDFDCNMDNIYGTATVRVPVACPTIKTVAEVAPQSLPNTGPGETIAAGFAISVISGYFFMRNRLLSREVGIAKEIYQSGGF